MTGRDVYLIVRGVVDAEQQVPAPDGHLERVVTVSYGDGHRLTVAPDERGVVMIPAPAMALALAACLP